MRLLENGLHQKRCQGLACGTERVSAPGVSTRGGHPALPQSPRRSQSSNPPPRWAELSSGPALLLLIPARLWESGRKAAGGQVGECRATGSSFGQLKPLLLLALWFRLTAGPICRTGTGRSLLPTPRNCFGPRAIYLCQHPFKLVLFSIPL